MTHFFRRDWELSPSPSASHNEHVYSLKAEINTENTINKKVKVKLYTNGQNKKHNIMRRVHCDTGERISPQSHQGRLVHASSTHPQNFMKIGPQLLSNLVYKRV